MTYNYIVKYLVYIVMCHMYCYRHINIYVYIYSIKYIHSPFTLRITVFLKKLLYILDFEYFLTSKIMLKYNLQQKLKSFRKIRSMALVECTWRS